MERTHKLRREKRYTPKVPPAPDPEPLDATLAMLWNAKKKPPKK